MNEASTEPKMEKLVNEKTMMCPECGINPAKIGIAVFGTYTAVCITCYMSEKNKGRF